MLLKEPKSKLSKMLFRKGIKHLRTLSPKEKELKLDIAIVKALDAQEQKSIIDISIKAS